MGQLESKMFYFRKELGIEPYSTPKAIRRTLKEHNVESLNPLANKLMADAHGREVGVMHAFPESRNRVGYPYPDDIGEALAKLVGPVVDISVNIYHRLAQISRLSRFAAGSAIEFIK